MQPRARKGSLNGKNIYKLRQTALLLSCLRRWPTGNITYDVLFIFSFTIHSQSSCRDEFGILLRSPKSPTDGKESQIAKLHFLGVWTRLFCLLRRRLVTAAACTVWTYVRSIPIPLSEHMCVHPYTHSSSCKHVDSEFYDLITVDISYLCL